MGSKGRIPSPDGLAPPPGVYRSWDDYMRDEEFDALMRAGMVASRAEYDDLQRVGKAMRLAPSLQVFEALIAGQQVPVSALDETWRARYGL